MILVSALWSFFLYALLRSSDLCVKRYVPMKTCPPGSFSFHSKILAYKTRIVIFQIPALPTNVVVEISGFQKSKRSVIFGVVLVVSKEEADCFMSVLAAFSKNHGQ
jgi:hypothetical protein